jgi:hypothetical protein
MHTNRREALKHILIFAGGVLLLPSCLKEEGKEFISLKNINIDGNEEALLTELASTLIPVTDTPGAKEVGAHLFALKIIDDCYEIKEQQKFTKGIQQCDKHFIKRYGNTFVESSSSQKEEFLTLLEKQNNFSEEINFFYSTYKKLCIRGYLNSKYYMTKVNPYQLVPVHFYGCVPVKKKDKKS